VAVSHSRNIPIIKLYDTLIVSIQVELSDAVVAQLQEDIANEIQRLGPRGLIIDVSGVDIMDSYISHAIRDIGQISQLMGVTTVLCGLDPMVAMTLVEMGMDLQGVTPFMDMETAFEALHASAQADKDDEVLRWFS
jgi:rsbT antagonist protein RsbS